MAAEVGRNCTELGHFSLKYYQEKSVMIFRKCENKKVYMAQSKCNASHSSRSDSLLTSVEKSKVKTLAAHLIKFYQIPSKPQCWFSMLSIPACTAAFCKDSNEVTDVESFKN